VVAGVGGYGGDGNFALGGNVEFGISLPIVRMTGSDRRLVPPVLLALIQPFSVGLPVKQGRSSDFWR
jgi:hypothetical protein